MQIGILSGAIRNAGDFLIEKRSFEIIKHIYPDAELIRFQRTEPLNHEIERMNQCDFIVLAGGPAFQPDIYSLNGIPLVDNLDDIIPPMYSLGLGWYGKVPEDLYTVYKFTDKTRQLINRLAKDAPLSCRDWYTVRALQENGYSNCIMAGCPAWYCLDILTGKERRKNVGGGREAICISDPARKKNFDLIIPLIKTVKKMYPDSPIHYVMHRNNGELLSALGKEWRELKVETSCIEKSADGFSLYDDCKFHIGFRVHAHIYNLSRGGESILINEDARGMGVNNALGLENLNIDTLIRVAENRTGRVKISIPAKDSMAIFQRKVEHYLEMNSQTDGLLYERAWMSIEKYYDVMCDNIKGWQSA